MCVKKIKKSLPFPIRKQLAQTLRSLPNPKLRHSSHALETPKRISPFFDSPPNRKLHQLLNVHSRRLPKRIRKTKKFTQKSYQISLQGGPGMMYVWTSGLLGIWASGFLGFWASGHLGFWASGHLGFWVSWLLGIWASELLVIWNTKKTSYDMIVVIIPKTFT